MNNTTINKLLFIAGSACIFIAGYATSKFVNALHTREKGVYVEYYKKGQILPPDYVCTDTLIVVDNVGLNKAMGLIEQGYDDADDNTIDSIFHCYCKVK